VRNFALISTPVAFDELWFRIETRCRKSETSSWSARD